MNGSFLFGAGASCVIVGLVTELVELKYQLAETQRDLGAVRRLLLADEHPSSSGAGVVTVAAGGSGGNEDGDPRRVGSPPVRVESSTTDGWAVGPGLFGGGADGGPFRRLAGDDNEQCMDTDEVAFAAMKSALTVGEAYINFTTTLLPELANVSTVRGLIASAMDELRKTVYNEVTSNREQLLLVTKQLAGKQNASAMVSLVARLVDNKAGNRSVEMQQKIVQHELEAAKHERESLSLQLGDKANTSDILVLTDMIQSKADSATVAAQHKELIAQLNSTRADQIGLVALMNSKANISDVDELRTAAAAEVNRTQKLWSDLAHKLREDTNTTAVDALATAVNNLLTLQSPATLQLPVYSKNDSFPPCGPKELGNMIFSNASAQPMICRHGQTQWAPLIPPVCDADYEHVNLAQTKCEQNICVCSKGTAKNGSACTTHGAAMCSACDAGYRLDSAKTKCEQNICVCSKGTAKDGSA